MRLDSFAKNSIIMFISSSVGSFFNLLYQWFILRATSPETFASFNSLLSLLVILLFPLISFTTMVTKHISCSNALEDKDNLRGLWQAFARHAFIFSILAFAVMAGFSGPLAHFLHIESHASVMILGAIIFVSGINAVFMGGLQGLEKFMLLAVIGVIAGFLKLISPLLFFKIFHQLEGALLGLLVAIAASVILSLKAVKPLAMEKTKAKINMKEQYFFLLPVAGLSLFSLLLTNLDMVMVKHFFILEAQDYAVAQMLGKCVLFISGYIYIVMFSRVCSLRAQNAPSLGILKRTLAFTFVLGAGICIFYNLFPVFTLKILANRFNPQMVLLGRIFSLNMLIFSLSTVLFYYQLSLERYNFLLPSFLVTACLFVLLWFWHLNIFFVVGTISVAMFLILVVNIKYSFKSEAA